MKLLLAQIAQDFGTPCFVYSIDEVYEQIKVLRERFEGRFKISYAVKANPNREILRRLLGHVDTLDISSAGELHRSLESGWQASALSFTGPAKRASELAAAVEHKIGEVIVESVQEAEQLDAVAGVTGTNQPILVRIAPSLLPKGFGINMAGKPSQFGIDEEEVDSALEVIAKLRNLTLVGFHIYSGTQCLNADSICENYEIFVDIFRRVVSRHGVTPKKLIFGSGLGVPYHEGDEPLDMAAIAQRVNPLIDDLRSEEPYRATECVLETGRFLIGEAGLYLTKVVRRKSSRGTEIGICDGGMHHHLGACGHLGSVIHRNYPMFKVSDDLPEVPLEPYDLVGPLCTSIDTLGHGVQFRGLEVDDLIAVRSSGAYGLTASPNNFISHPPPKEILVASDQGQQVVKDISQFKSHSSESIE